MKNRILQTIAVMIVVFSGQSVRADTLEVVNEDFDGSFSGFVLQTNASSEATSSFVLGDVEGSTGLVFTGNWNLVPDIVEFSAGILSPQFPPTESWRVAPADLEGLSQIEYSVDIILNGFNDDNADVLYVQLLIYQLQDDNSISVFTQWAVTTSITNTNLQNINVKLKREDFINSNGEMPSFGPHSNPMSFGLQLGAQYYDHLTSQVRQGHLRLDNWSVTVSYPDLVFYDGFEDDL